MKERLAKLLFIVREIELGRYLAERARDDDQARAWARRVLIRVADLLDHAAQLQGPLASAGNNITEFREARLEVEAQFGEYFRVTRNRLSAHLQDVDLRERVDLWLDVDAPKLDYFVDAAHEIYEGRLGDLSLAAREPFSSFSELSDPSFRPFSGVARGWRHGAEIAVDSLAMTRPDAVAVLNTSPSHERAQMLALLERWIPTTIRLEASCSHNQSNARRMFRAQLITDVISFADCLFTRADAPPKQAMDGLDRLVAQDSSSLSDVLTRTHIRSQVESLRVVRNLIGAHLDVGSAGLDELIAMLDNIDLAALHRLFVRMDNAFREVCRDVFYLRTYLMNGQVLEGVSAVRPEGGKTPFGSKMPRVKVELKLASDVDPLKDPTPLLDAWKASAGLSSVVLPAVRDAVRRGPVQERVPQKSGGTLDLRQIHLALVDALRAASLPEHLRLLELVRALARGSPRPLAEVLARSLDLDTGPMERARWVAALHAAATLPLEDVGPLGPAIERGLGSIDLHIRVTALLALYSRSVLRAAMHTQEPTTTPAALARTEGWSVQDKLLGLAVLASAVHAGMFPVVPEQFEFEVRALAERIAEIVPLVAPGISPQLAGAIVAQGYCVALVPLTIDHVGSEIREAFLTAAIAGMLPPNPRVFDTVVMSDFNLCLVEHEVGRDAAARSRLARIWRRLSGSKPQLAVACVECAIEIGMDAGAYIGELATDFRLTAELQRRVTELHSEIAAAGEVTEPREPKRGFVVGEFNSWGPVSGGAEL